MFINRPNFWKIDSISFVCFHLSLGLTSDQPVIEVRLDLNPWLSQESHDDCHALREYQWGCWQAKWEHSKLVVYLVHNA